MTKSLELNDIDYTESIEKAKLYLRVYLRKMTAATEAAPYKSQKVHLAGTKFEVETSWDIDKKMTAHIRSINAQCIALHGKPVWDFDKEEKPSLTGGMVD